MIADEGQTQTRIAGQWSNRDFGDLGAQFLDGGVQIINCRAYVL